LSCAANSRSSGADRPALSGPPGSWPGLAPPPEPQIVQVLQGRPRLTYRFFERNSVSVTCRLQVAPPKGQVLVVASTLGAGDGLKVLFTKVAMTARSAAEGGSMLVMNVPGRRAQRLQRLVNFAMGLLA
jgi:hypothetical protein